MMQLDFSNLQVMWRGTKPNLIVFAFFQASFSFLRPFSNTVSRSIQGKRPAQQIWTCSRLLLNFFSSDLKHLLKKSRHRDGGIGEEEEQDDALDDDSRR